MVKFEFYLNKIICWVKYRTRFFVFFLSIASLLIAFLNVINIPALLGTSNVYILDLVFRIAAVSSTIFIILFLPTYPYFFFISNQKKFNILEKLGLTIVSNLVFYILTGYIGFYVGFSITGTFFFLALVVSYSSLVLLEILLDFKKGSIKLFKLRNGSLSELSFGENFSIIKFLREKIPINGLLVIAFLGLICFYNIVRFSYFFGTDAWYHVFIIKKITSAYFLPVNEYYGTMGFHIFGAVIQFFSGVEVVLIPRYFVFYTFFLSALIYYNLQMRIFRNQNLAFLGVFLLMISGLWYSHMMIQFWPTSLTVIQCLLIFFLLYVRLQDFIKGEKPTKDEIFSNILFSYMLIISCFMSAILTHSLTTILLLLSYLFVYFIYFLKDYLRGIDFLLLCALLTIFLLFYNFTLISGHFWFMESFVLPWYLLIFAGAGGGVIIWRIKKSILFTSGRFSAAILGQKRVYFKKIEEKYVIPFSLSFISIVIVLLSIFNSLIFDLNFTFIFWMLEIFLLVVYGLWGFFLFQKKPRGKPLLIWCYGIALIFGVAFALDVFVSEAKISGRIFLLFSPILTIGFVSYMYKLIKLKSINTHKTRLFILIIVLISFSNFFFFELINVDNQEYNLKRREVSSVAWLSKYTSDKNVIISEFGWDYIFMNYEYPFAEKDEQLRGKNTNYYLYNQTKLYDPSNHVNENGTNVLKSLKKEYKTDVFIILDDTYLTLKGWQSYGRLTHDEMEEYYDLKYLNKISSTKSENGAEIPCYWVI